MRSRSETTMKSMDQQRKILKTASQQTESTAASTTDNDEDSFTDLICRRRRVRFAFPPSYRSDEGEGAAMGVPGIEAVTDSSDLWYNKDEVALHRRDVQRTIRTLRKHTHCGAGSAHVLLATTCCCHTSDAGCKHDADYRSRGESNIGKGGGGRSTADDDVKEQICFRGCERYYSLETRYMAQKLVVDAVLDAQRKDGMTIVEMRQISEDISQPGKDLAVWHATLNAFQCYGFSGIYVVPSPTKVEASVVR